MSKTITKAPSKKAEELMRKYAQVTENKAALLKTIENELKAYNDQLTELSTQLKEYGAENADKFNEKGNLELEHGYLHIAHQTIVSQGKKFDVAEFNQARPDLIDVKLKTALVKKAWLDKDQNKELKALGVVVDTEKVMEVKLYS